MAKAALILENLHMRPRDLAERYGIRVLYLRQVRSDARLRGLSVPRFTPTAPTWSAAEIAYLRRHYNRDMSAAEIASHLGKTRNAVIGKADRLGLTGA